MTFTKKTTLILLFFLSVSLFMPQTLFAQQKFALVIGNGNYTGISRLNNPVNDANDMETALRELGFTVDKVLNGSLEQMENAVLNLVRRLGVSQDSYGFFFYAGHGVQSSGENYLIPVEADNIRSEAQLRSRSVSLQFIMDSLSEAGNELNMIVLDACRDNPFSWARGGSRGLTVLSGAPAGSIVMYATGANAVAEDGSGRNGLFTGQLLENLRTPGLSVQEVFNRTGEAVLRVSNGRQHPELSMRYFAAASAYLGVRPEGAPAAVTPQPIPAPAAVTPRPAPAAQSGLAPTANAKPNWLSGELALFPGLGIGARYERMLGSKVSLGVNAHWTTSLLYDLGLHDLGVDASFRFYPWGKTFFLGAAFGFLTRISSYAKHHDDIFTYLLAITPEIGWKIDVGVPGKFFLQPGLRESILLGKDSNGSFGVIGIGVRQLIYFGMGYAF